MGVLFDHIAAVETLRVAWERVARKEARGGIDGLEVADFHRGLPQRLAALHRELVSGRYTPLPGLRVTIPKNDGRGGRRELGMLSIRDKIVQEAVRQAIEPIFEQRFLDCSYAYRPGRGPQRALARLNHYLQYEGRPWVVSCDIDDFFGSLDHDLLLAEIRAGVEDEDVLRLLSLWLKVGCLSPSGRWHEPFSGIVQGGIISPLLANTYLHPLDVFATQQGYALVRYADDLLLLATERVLALHAGEAVERFLAERLRLRLNASPQIRSWDGGFVFLGVYHRNGVRRTSNGKMEKMRRKIEEIVTGLKERPLDTIIDDLNEAVISWRRYYDWLEPKEQFAEIDQFLIGVLSEALHRRLGRQDAMSPDCLRSELSRLELLISHTREARITRLLAGLEPTPTAAGPEPITTSLARRRRECQRRLQTGAELFIEEDGVFLGKTSQRVVVRRQKVNVVEVPSTRLQHIIVASRHISLSAALIHHCAEQGITLDFLDQIGVPYARLEAPHFPHADVCTLQLEAARNGAGLELARRFIAGKLKNQLHFLQYCGKYWSKRNAAFAQGLATAKDTFAALLAEMQAAERRKDDLSQERQRLLSVEGRGGATYWGLVRELLREFVEFPGRQRQGATDLVNAALNYGYGVLYPRVRAALIMAGLNPMISFLHAQQEGKPTLAYDLIEEFRAQAVDRPVLSLIHQGTALVVNGTEGVLTPDSRKAIAQGVLKRLHTTLRFHGREVTLEEVITLQVRRLAAHLRGEQTYRPYVASW